MTRSKPTCFKWSYKVGKVQVLRYKRTPARRVDAKWVSKFMAWIRLGSYEVRLHL